MSEEPVRRSGVSLGLPPLLAAGFCLLFFLAGLAFIPYLGLQDDEGGFSAAIYPPRILEYATHLFGIFKSHLLPLMLMSYLGTLKAFLFKLIFAVFAPSVWSVRIPALVAGALTVWLFFVFVRRISGTPAALAAAALLSTDACFVLTTCMDWGPVALQHLLLIGGLLALWRFHEEGKPRFLAAGFFLFGLALWDKALFLWVLAGLTVATVALFPRALLARLTRRNLALAALSLMIGAAPLVAYNAKFRLATLRSNANFTTRDLDRKAAILRRTLDGQALFGYMVRLDPPAQATPAPTGGEALSVAVNEACGVGASGLLPWACLAALALLAWLWATPARRPMLFALIAMTVTWLQMAFTNQAGGSVHHTVLLWPLPHLIAAVGLAQGSRLLRRVGPAALAAAVALVCGSNLLVLNRYLADLIRNGPTTVWTDAVDPLSAYLRTSKAERMYVVDWGIMSPLRILNAGKLPLDIAPDAASRAAALDAFAAPDAVFISHTEGNESFLGVNRALDEVARSAGYRCEVLKVIGDRFGEPIFQVYRYAQPAR